MNNIGPFYFTAAPMWPKSYHTTGPKSTFLRHLVRRIGPYQKHRIQTHQALDVLLPNTELHSNTLKCIFNKTL